MNKTTKIWLIVATCLVVAGLAIAGITLAQAEFHINSLQGNQNMTEKTYAFDHAAIKTIQIVNGPNLLKVIGEDEKAGMICYEANDNVYYDIVVSESGDMQIIYRDERKWYQKIGFSLPQTMEIYLSKEQASQIDIDGRSGNVVVQGIKLKGLAVETASGGIQVKDIVCTEDTDLATRSGGLELERLTTGGSLWLEASSGKILGKEIQVDKAVTARASSGSIQIDAMETGEKAEILTSSGGITLSDVKTGQDMALSAVSGGIRLEDVAVSGNIEAMSTSGAIIFENLNGKDMSFQSTSGRIEGLVKGSSKEYFISAQSKSGNIDIPQTGRGEYLLKAATKSGRISIKFTQD